ncbi:MAG: ATP-binding protein [Burkholderiaceae bacterium]|nr:ATP-binding protein [Burkholderiaceae bacterium]
MPDDALTLNAADLGGDLDWLARLIDRRFKHYFGPRDGGAMGFEPPPDLSASASRYAALLRHYQASLAERCALVLALAPWLRPQLLDVFFTRNQNFDKPFVEFGGHHDTDRGAFWPSAETLVFLLAGDDLAGRLALAGLFDRDHWFARHGVLRLAAAGAALDADAAAPARLLRLSPDVLGLVTVGSAPSPELSAAFPAQHLHTDLAWDDLVLHPGTLAQVREIEAWLRHGDTLMDDWGMAAKLRPGYRALFYGPPGTGKTMTATLLGRATGREVYKIDLSLVVSKYIGETEKNLSRVFDAAQHKGWLLFFDEADALFGKRSETRDAHDRYANQEVSYLLQRIETFDGVAILASNQKDNLDAAFARRFEAVIYFPMPRAEERLQLWRQGFPAAVTLDAGVDLAQLAQRHELCGGAIMNVVRYACLVAAEDGSHRITAEALQRGIRRELAKEGRAA